MAELGGDYMVVAPDLRGYNLSDKPPRVEDYQMDRLVDDILGLIRHFGRQEAAIIGHDWGAAVAWSVALKYPEGVRKLAALQVPHPAAWHANMTWRQALRSWYMLLFQLPWLPEWLISAGDFAALERSFKRTVVRRGSITPTDIAIYKKALREPGALTAAVNYYRANFTAFLKGGRTRGVETNSGRVRVPTLFIYGEQDFAIIPETVRGVGAYVDAPYHEVRIAQSGHWVQQEAPAEVSAALRDFLESA